MPISMSSLRPLYRTDILEWTPEDISCWKKYQSLLETNRAVTKEYVDALNLRRGQKIAIRPLWVPRAFQTKYFQHDESSITTVNLERHDTYDFRELAKVSPLLTLAEAAKHLGIMASTLSACYGEGFVCFGRDSNKILVDNFKINGQYYITNKSMERLKEELRSRGGISPEEARKLEAEHRKEIREYYKSCKQIALEGHSRSIDERAYRWQQDLEITAAALEDLDRINGGFL